MPVDPGDPDDLARLSEADRRLVLFSRRFDLRNIIGLVLAVYGVVCVVVGLLHRQADAAKAAGLAINLWTGVPLVVIGVAFFVWNRVSPRPVEDLVHPEDELMAPTREGPGPRGGPQ